MSVSQTPITIVVEFKTKPGEVETAKAIVDELLPHVLAEDGNVSVQMFQDPEDETKFLFVETFVSAEAEKAHTQTPHMAKFYADIAAPLEGESVVKYWRPYGMFDGKGRAEVDFGRPGSLV